MIKAFLKKVFRITVLIISSSGTGKYLGKISLVKKIEKRFSQYITPEFVIFHGHRLYLDKGDVLRLSTFGPEKEVIENEIYNKYIKKGDIVVDIGAFIGDNTLEFARLVGRNGKVYAFEITKDCFDLLLKNIKENKYKNVVIINKAASDKNKKEKMYIHPFRPTANRIYGKDTANKKIDWDITEVDAVKLDSVIKGKVDFIKIDTEGAEPKVINGAKRILKNNKNLKMVLEISPATISNFGISPYKYIKRFMKWGFKIYDIDMKKEFEKNKKEIRTEQEINEFINKKYEVTTSNIFLIKGGKKC